MPIKSRQRQPCPQGTYLEYSVAFWRDIPGMKEVARHHGAMGFFSFGSSHHDLGQLQPGCRPGIMEKIRML